MWLSDEHKKEIAKKKNYKVLTVWEMDLDDKQKTTRTILQFLRN